MKICTINYRKEREKKRRDTTESKPWCQYEMVYNEDEIKSVVVDKDQEKRKQEIDWMR